MQMKFHGQSSKECWDFPTFATSTRKSQATEEGRVRKSHKIAIGSDRKVRKYSLVDPL